MDMDKPLVIQKLLNTLTQQSIDYLHLPRSLVIRTNMFEYRKVAEILSSAGLPLPLDAIQCNYSCEVKLVDGITMKISMLCNPINGEIYISLFW